MTLNSKNRFFPVKIAPQKQEFTFSAGNAQRFPEKSCIIDMEMCTKCGLSANGKYFPLVLKIVRVQHKY